MYSMEQQNIRATTALIEKSGRKESWRMLGIMAEFSVRAERLDAAQSKIRFWRFILRPKNVYFYVEQIFNQYLGIRLF